jgi:hypothetical protein
MELNVPINGRTCKMLQVIIILDVMFEKLIERWDA